MDSSAPPRPPAAQRTLRPWYLVPALVLAWCIGVQRLLAACSNVAFLRDATLPDVETATRNAREAGDVMEFYQLRYAVERAAMHDFSRVTFPVNVAQILLAALLVVATGLALSGRRGARLLAVQALAANAVLTAVGYALTPGMRVAIIDAMVNVASTWPIALPHRAMFISRETLWWSVRIEFFAMSLGSLVLVLFALTRSKTRVYFEAAARAAERGEENEP